MGNSKLEMIDISNETLDLMSKISRLGLDELAIVNGVVDRVLQGRDEYGDWDLEDRRNYLNETWEELLDAVIYLCADLQRLKRNGG